MRCEEGGASGGVLVRHCWMTTLHVGVKVHTGRLQKFYSDFMNDLQILKSDVQ